MSKAPGYASGFTELTVRLTPMNSSHWPVSLTEKGQMVAQKKTMPQKKLRKQNLMVQE